VAKHISEDFAAINQSTAEMAANSSQVNQSAEGLLGMANQLKDFVLKFRV
jgi:methyl-accepting chemotaxis protein